MNHHQDILSIIESHLEEMTDLEQKIADYFMMSHHQEVDLSSYQVSQTLHISQAALTRFAKKCGFKGYREFIFQYVHQHQDAPLETPHIQNELTRRVIHDYEQLNQFSQDLIHEDRLQTVAQMIDQAERVYFFGKGSSGLVAMESKLRFMRLGVVCEALTEQDGFAWTTSILDDSCLVIAFSLSGQTGSVIDGLLDSKEMGAKTVLLTTNEGENKEHFDQIITVAGFNQPYIRRISQQFPLLIMMDLLYAYFLEIDRPKKEVIFNRYWENKKLNGFQRRSRPQKDAHR